MKSYLLSFVIGLAVGLFYAFVRVRSPAPPIVALVGLLGMVAGEALPGLIHHRLRSDRSVPAPHSPSERDDR
jgi:XapX domain-containing protein